MLSMLWMKGQKMNLREVRFAAFRLAFNTNILEKQCSSDRESQKCNTRNILFLLFQSPITLDQGLTREYNAVIQRLTQIVF